MSSEKKRARITINKTVVIWTAVSLVVLMVASSGAAFAAVGYGRLYEGRIFPGVRVLDVRLDGLTADEARNALNKAVDEALKDGLRFRFTPNGGGETRDIVLNATTVATNDPDASRELIRYDVEPAIVSAIGYGRGNNLALDTLARWTARLRPVQLDAGVTIDENGVASGLAQAADDVLTDMKDATLNITWNAADNRAEVTTVPEQTGRVLDTEGALRVLRNQAERLRFEPIVLHDRELTPMVDEADVKKVADNVPSFLSHAPFRLQYIDKMVTVSTSTLASWLGVTVSEETPSLTIDPKRFGEGVRQLVPDIEKTAKQGTLVVENGAIKTFEAGTEGVAIDDTQTLAGILGTWQRGETSSTFPLVVVRTEPALSGQDPERLGIKEIIGIGRSDFSGSPTNRRKNIANGIKKVNGTLIMPGEEFSMLKVLGPIEANQGWLPELVIKGNSTVPELGGGLCQIGTTTFRAALDSGLPITERRNHSYRVRYYEPVGTDATIYDPAPDFRFKNDMKTAVLIHAYQDKDTVIYEFWGTDDGRSTLYKGTKDVTTVAELKPRVFNQTSPPPMKLIETLDLKPGEKKCTETAHAGADAEFDYSVTYADGTKNEQTFRSHYRPWQAVCLIGVEKLSTPPAEGDADAGGSPDSAAADAVR